MTAALPITKAPRESIFRPAAVLMCGRMLSFAATFFIPVVLVRVFDQAQFGTYKQLFLIQLTIYSIAQFGMASSLYYFIPLAPAKAGSYIANSLLFLTLVGIAGLAGLSLAAPRMAVWMSNAALSRYLPWLGVYLLLTMVSAPLEMILISRHQYLLASASYAASDLARAAVLICAALLSGQLIWLLRGVAAIAAIRVAVLLFFCSREFVGSLHLDRSLFKSQLVYAVPFGCAVLVEILQGNVPAYFVSYLTSPAAFAIFAVGCLQIPLVDFAASPASDVMMVRMQEFLAEGRKSAVLEIWHDTTWKLALFLVPLVALVTLLSHDIIILLFTQKYAASVPIFIAWTSIILLTIFQVDGALRVFAQTRLILILNLVRLGIVAGLLKWSLATFHLLGPALVIVFAMLVFKVAALFRIKKLLSVSAGELLPWWNLISLAGVAAISAAAAFLVKSQLHVSVIATLIVASLVFGAVYIALVWTLGLLASHERTAITAALMRPLNFLRA
jgi:O-antigen/teichoic acid export membrane protein